MARALSETGCIDLLDPGRPAPGLVPYQVNAPLWSDGADKARYLAIPDEAVISVGADSDFDLPLGSVAVKTFSFGARLVETRLLVREETGWTGYSYEWNDDGTDAFLVEDPAGKLRRIEGRDWFFPGADGCRQCHTAAAGGTLGLEAAQLDRALTYPSGRTANQLTTLAALGILPSRPVTTALAAPDDQAAPLATRARSYLHANCSGCHRPGGVAETSMDLRATSPLAATGTCDVPPQKESFGLEDARLVAPGAPERSVLLMRMRSPGRGRMPPLGSSELDSAGSRLVADWIRELTRCE